MPTSLGSRDVALLLTPPHDAASAWSRHLIASPFGTIEPATISYVRPIGTAMPRPPVYLVNYEEAATDGGAGAGVEQFAHRPPPRIVYPTVNRRLKGNRLPSAAVAPAAPAAVVPADLPRLQPIESAPGPTRMPALTPAVPPSPAAPSATAAPAPKTAVPARSKPAPRAAVPARARDAAAAATDGGGSAADREALHVALPPSVPAAGDLDAAAAQDSSAAALAYADDGTDAVGGQIFFGAAAMGMPSGLESWAPGAEPVMVQSAESGIKLSALEGTPGDGPGGETVAGKDDAARMLSPAQRLGLAGHAREHAEKCLTAAIYWEARGETLRGQEAVAQVVMNRVFSGYYPRNVCGVVYQNASHYLACQFTFACEGRNLNRIDEPDMWAQAKRIAKDTLDGKIWLADVGHATHYHAYWVHPSWVHEMKRVDRIGVHTFYRPRAWGSGDDEPVWGPAARSAKDAAADKPQADAAAPKAQGTVADPTASL